MAKRNTSTEFIKESLSDALFLLMEKEPYDEINVKEICYKSGIGRTSYYRYFDNKNGKKDLIINKIHTTWTEYASTRMDQIIEDVLLVVLHYFYDNRYVFDLLRKNDLLNSMISYLFFVIYDPKKIADTHEAYAKAFLAGGLYGMIFHWIDSDYHISPQELHAIYTKNKK